MKLIVKNKELTQGQFLVLASLCQKHGPSFLVLPKNGGASARSLKLSLNRLKKLRLVKTQLVPFEGKLQKRFYVSDLSVVDEVKQLEDAFAKQAPKQAAGILGMKQG